MSRASRASLNRTVATCLPGRPFGHMRARTALMAVLTVMAALALLAMAALPGPAGAQTLNSDLWKRQPLLLFAKSRSDAQKTRQEAILRDRRSEIEARDMVVITIAGSGPPIASIGFISLPTGATRELRQRFNPDPSLFTAILVNSDGKEIGRWNRPVDPDVLFDLLDAQDNEGGGEDGPEPPAPAPDGAGGAG